MSAFAPIIVLLALALPVEPAKFQPEMTVDTIVTGVSVSAQAKRKWRAMRARYKACQDCMKQPFPQD